MTETTGEEFRVLREKNLAFFGTVTASLSHEINNVVAIVGELTGLLDDLLYAAEGGRPLNLEKLKDLSARLSKQVKKGETIIKRLNRFAHSVDEPVKQVNIKELLLQILAIAERFAFLKGIKLESQFTDDSVVIETNPFFLQQAVFLCIQLALSAAQKNDVIQIGFSQEKSGIRIFLNGVNLTGTAEVAAKTDFLSVLMKELGGDFDIAPAHGAAYAIALTIPR
jgi:C4-dicarboxylate-specific signal transduction histidine kinase